MSYKTNFSQVRCREIAASQRLMMEMPEPCVTLATRLLTILACDYDGTRRLQDFANAIYRDNAPPTDIFRCDIANCPNAELKTKR